MNVAKKRRGYNRGRGECQERVTMNGGTIKAFREQNGLTRQQFAIGTLVAKQRELLACK